MGSGGSFGILVPISSRVVPGIGMTKAQAWRPLAVAWLDPQERRALQWRGPISLTNGVHPPRQLLPW
jgi:hypothetical protein